jgi:hypothetical protein
MQSFNRFKVKNLKRFSKFYDGPFGVICENDFAFLIGAEEWHADDADWADRYGFIHHCEEERRSKPCSEVSVAFDRSEGMARG